MCKVLKVHRSGYYAWLRDPQCQRKKDDAYLLGYVKQFWLESGGVYGYRKITKDMKVLGETCGRNRILRLMKGAGISAQRGYKRRASYKSGEISMVAENHLNREFSVPKPNLTWVMDITYIRTHEGWLFLAVVLDLYSRSVIGWSMSDRINTGLALGALTMACWRRRDHAGVVVHSDQGCQYTSYEWRSMLKANGLKASMSRRGNCHDNACAESFFSLLKKNGLDAAHTQLGKLRNPMCSIILNCFTIQHDAMEITVTCHPWSLKITILGTKQVSKKVGAYQTADG